MLPSDISKLRHWYRANDETGYSNGDRVNPIVDQSGNTLDATQATSSSRAIYRTNQINGKAAFEFGSTILGPWSGSQHAVPDGTLAVNGSCEMFAVVKLNNEPPIAEGRTGPIFGDADSGVPPSAYPYTDGVIYLGFATAARHTIGDAPDGLTSWHILHIRSTTGGGAGAGTLTLWIDGVEIFTTSTSTFADPGAMVLGYDTRANFGLDGYIAEVFTFDEELDGAEEAGMYEYINTEYFSGVLYESQANGNWEDNATWQGGVAPPNPLDGDVITSHNVDINSDLIIGKSVNDVSYNALEVAGGTLTIKDSYSLSCRGGILISPSAVLQIGEDTGGGELSIDSTLASSETHYKISGGGILRSRGIEPNRSLFLSDSSGDTAYVDVMKVDMKFCKLQNIGDATRNALNNILDGHTPVIENCVFENCGRISIVSQGATDAASIKNNTMRGTVVDPCIAIAASTNPSVGVIREFSDNCFDRRIDIDTKDVVLNDNFFFGSGAWVNTNFGGSAGVPASILRPLIRINGEEVLIDGMVPQTDWNDGSGWDTAGVMINDGNTLDFFTGEYTNEGAEETVFNPHWIGGGNCTLYNMIFIDLQSTGGGDITLHHSEGVLTLDHCITIYDGGGGAASTLATVAAVMGASLPEHKFFHCTHHLGTGAEIQNAVACGELNSGYEDQLEVKDSIFHNSVAATAGTESGHVVGTIAGPDTVVTDIGTGPKLDYNGIYNLNLTNSEGPTPGGPSYNINTTLPCGVHDVIANPQFIDVSVTFWKWQQTIEASWTGVPTPTRTQRNARALWKLSLKNEPSHAEYDSRYNLQALVLYIARGFTPTNLALVGTASDGKTIGAVEVFMCSTTLVHSGATFTAGASFTPVGGAPKTFYFKNAVASGSNYLSIQDEGTRPATATTATGWTVGTLTANNFSDMQQGVERGTGTFSAGGEHPPSVPDNTLGTAWRSENLIYGNFLAGTWTLRIPVVAVSNGGHDVRFNIRVQRSTSATGAGALSFNEMFGYSINDFVVGVPQVIEFNFNPGALVFHNYYLFIQIAIEAGGGGAADSDVLFRVGDSADIVTPNFVTPPQYQIDVSVTHSGATFTAAASAAPPAFSGSAVLVHSGATIAATVTAGAPTFSGSANIVHSGANFTAVAASSVPGFAASATLTHSGTLIASLAAFTSADEFGASANLTHSGATFSGTATTEVPEFTATVTASSNAPNFIALTDLHISDFFATCELVLPAAVFIASATRAYPALYVDSICADVCWDFIIADVEFPEF